MSGFMSDKLGRKYSLIIAAILFFISAVVTALPETFTALIIYRIIGGIGVASLVSPHVHC